MASISLIRQNTFLLQLEAFCIPFNPLIERCYLNETIYQDVKQRLLSFKAVLGASFYEPILHAVQNNLQAAVLEDDSDKVDSEKKWNKAIAKERQFLDNRVEDAIKLMDKFLRLKFIKQQQSFQARFI